MIRLICLYAIALGCLPGCSWVADRRAIDGPTIVDGDVLFQFYAPTARRVQLAGDWPENNWARGDGGVGEADIGLMSDADGDGVWELAVRLKAGRYRYVFWVDETTWHLDPGNHEEVEGGPARRCSQLVIFSTQDNLEIR